MLDERVNAHVNTLINRYPDLDVCKESIVEAYNLLEQAYSKNRKLLVCGNGGSAADAEHIVGELMKEFKLKRKVYRNQAQLLREIDSEKGDFLAQNLQGALPAIALVGHCALSTAYMNDSESVLVFAQQVNGYGKADDVLLAISTSGNSENVVYAAITAKSKGMKVLALTGSKESKLSALADVCIKAPDTETYRIQEYHLPIYHCLCLMLEEKFFG